MVQGLFSLTGDRRRRTGGAALMIIQAHGLRKRFRVRTRAPGTLGALRGLVMPHRRRITAVDDIELAVDRGEVIAFIGPNGAGKSTTIKLLTGILHRDAGTVSVLGMDPQRHRRRLAYRIATVFGQKSQLWFHLPPIDTFRLLADVYDVEPRRAPVRKLSGERIRSEIIADSLTRRSCGSIEPTIGLDVVIRQRIRDLIADGRAHPLRDRRRFTTRRSCCSTSPPSAWTSSAAHPRPDRGGEPRARRHGVPHLARHG